MTRLDFVYANEGDYYCVYSPCDSGYCCNSESIGCVHCVCCDSKPANENDCIVCRSHQACKKEGSGAQGGFCGWSNKKPVVAKHWYKVSDGCTNVCTCDPTKPYRPVPISPNNISIGTSENITFRWTVTSNWGEECLMDTPREYQICISSEDKLDCGDEDTTIDTTGGGDTNRVTVNVGDAKISSGVNYWKMRSRNRAEIYSNWTSSFQFTAISGTPTLTSLVLRNGESTVAIPDNTNYYQICNSIFQNSATPRRIIFQATFYDEYGGNLIDSGSIVWNGYSYPLTMEAPGDTTRVGTAVVDFTPSENSDNTNPLQVSVVNTYGVGSTYSPAYLKVWDCQVDVSGSIFDGSLGQSCNNTGFTIPIDSDLAFSSLLFNGTSTADVVMTPSLPASYGGNGLIWGYYYLPIFNGGSVAHPDGNLMVSARLTRLIDLGTGTTHCPVSSEFIIGTNIDPYTVNPQVKIDFSFARSQEAWFQVSGAGVKAKNVVGSGVPLTADPATRALSITGILADNGLVSFATYSNINGNNNDTDYGLSNNWWINRSTNSSNVYSYQNFYNNFFVNRSIGETGINWDSKPSEGLYFVNGNLNIDSDFTLASGKFLMVVVRGNITIADTVNRLDGIYVADGGITASGFSDTQLIINGMLYSRNNIRLSRSYVTKILNNTLPATKVNYRPDLIFNMPGILLREVSGWREE